MKLERRIVSGARVMFDPRGTAEANTTRDYTNRKSRKPQRKRKDKDQ